MATELPLFHTEVIHTDQNLQEATLQDDAFLQELLGVPEDDLLTSLLDSTSANGSANEPLNFDFDLNPLLNIPTSPVDSDISTGNSPPYVNQTNSPASFTSGSDGLGGDSPLNSSPSPYMMPPFSSSLGMSEPTLTTLMASNEVDQQLSSSPVDLSSDVRIDVDYMTTTQASDLTARQQEASPGGKTDLKAHTLMLTEEEKKLLAEEGVTLPTDMPLTKAEQKDLKRVRRKIKNKISAQESRKRKKDYVDGLEDRVKICTDRNRELKREVDCLREQNLSLMSQLKKLQAIVAQYNPSKVQAGSVLLVIVMSFSMFFVPKYGAPKAMRGISRGSRSLLFTETDEFGNVIDPDNGLIISKAGGQSPNFPPPWINQTPVLRFSSRPGLPDNYFREQDFEGKSTQLNMQEAKTEDANVSDSNSHQQDASTRESLQRKPERLR